MKLISHVVVSFGALYCTDARLASPFHQEPGTKASLVSTFPEAHIDLELVAHMADFNAMMGQTHPPGWPLAPVTANRSHSHRPYRSKHAQELFKQNRMRRGISMGMGMGSTSMGGVHDAARIHAEPKRNLIMSEHTKHSSKKNHHHRHHELSARKSVKSQEETSEDVVSAESDVESDGSTQRLVEMTEKWSKGELSDVDELQNLSQDEKTVEKSADFASSNLHGAAKVADGTSSDKSFDSVGQSRVQQSLGDVADASKDAPPVLQKKYTAKSKVDKSKAAQALGDAVDTSKSAELLPQRHSAKGNPDTGVTESLETLPQAQKTKIDDMSIEGSPDTSTTESLEALPEAEKTMEDDMIADVVDDMSIKELFGNSTSTSHTGLNTASTAMHSSAQSNKQADSDKSSGMQEHMAEVLGRIRAKRVASVSRSASDGAQQTNHESIDVKSEDNVTIISESNATDEVQETHQKSNSTKSLFVARREQATEEETAREHFDKVATRESLARESLSDAQNQTNHSSEKHFLTGGSSSSADADQYAVKHDRGQVTSEHIAAEKIDSSEAQQSNETHEKLHPQQQVIDDPLPRRGRATAELDASKLAWLHVPKTGTSFANTLASWACPDLKESDFVGASDGSETLLGGFMEHHGDKCMEGFSFCNGHTPISRDSCNDWNSHEGHFVGMFREPEQRIISGYKQNCHDVPGKDHTLPEYAEMVSGCSVKMLNGEECGSNITVTSDMVKHAIRRIEEGFAFAGLTEEWALSVCLFHTMFGGKCHPREFMDVRPGLTHRDMPYDASDLNGWVDPYDGALYAHASTVFWDNIAKYGVSPDSCKRTVCAETPDEFKLSVLRQR